MYYYCCDDRTIHSLKFWVMTGANDLCGAHDFIPCQGSSSLMLAGAKLRLLCADQAVNAGITSVF